MSRYSHFCHKCGWTSGIVNSPASYYDCPLCGESFSIISTSIDSEKGQLYNHTCTKCGWKSGPTTTGGMDTCPSCGKHSCVKGEKIQSSSSSSSSSDNDYSESGNSNSFSGSSSSSSEGSSSSSEGYGCALFIITVLALYFVAALVFWPGLLISMFIDTSTAWKWVIGIAISLVIFLCCKFDWKKYLVIDIIIIVISALSCWLIDSFTPVQYILHEIGPFSS